MDGDGGPAERPSRLVIMDELLRGLGRNARSGPPCPPPPPKQKSVELQSAATRGPAMVWASSAPVSCLCFTSYHLHASSSGCRDM